jgi:hypothetical protein
LTHEELKGYLAERGIDLTKITRTRAIINVDVKTSPLPFRFPRYLEEREFFDERKAQICSWDIKDPAAQEFAVSHKNRKKITCIKILREKFGLSLKGAKDFYEANENVFSDVFNVKRIPHVY